MSKWTKQSDTNSMPRWKKILELPYTEFHDLVTGKHYTGSQFEPLHKDGFNGGRVDTFRVKGTDETVWVSSLRLIGDYSVCSLVSREDIG